MCNFQLIYAKRLSQPVSESEKSLNFKKVMSAYVFFHRLIGILPLENRDYDFLGCRLFLIYFLFAGLVNMILFLRYTIVRLVQGVIELDSLFVTVMAVSTVIRYYLLVSHRLEFRDAINACSAIWEECSPKEHMTVRWFERKIWLLFKLLAGSGLFINILGSVSSIAVRLPPDEPNGTERRLLPYRWFLDESEYHWLGYNWAFAMQVSISHHLTIITPTVDTAGPLLMMMSCGFFKVLQDRFYTVAGRNEKSANKNDVEFQKTLIFYIKFHQNVLDLCKRVDTMTQLMYLVQLLSFGYNISLIGLKLTGSDPERFQYIPHLILSLGVLFITQWSSDCLLEESEGVATAAYFATMMSLNSKIGGLLLTVIRRAQTPVQMTAGGVIHLSIERFGNLISNAFSFFMVLRNFTA